MSRKTNMLLAAGVGLTLALTAVPDRDEVPSSPEPAPQAAVPAAAPAVEVGVLEAASAHQIEAQRARVAELTWERDPFADPAPRSAPPEANVQAVESTPATEPIVADVPLPVAPRRPHLTGVSRSLDERWAIIDGQIVRAGETLFSGHTVLRIEARSVTVLLEDEGLNLKLGEQR